MAISNPPRSCAKRRPVPMENPYSLGWVPVTSRNGSVAYRAPRRSGYLSGRRAIPEPLHAAVDLVGIAGAGCALRHEARVGHRPVAADHRPGDGERSTRREPDGAAQRGGHRHMADRRRRKQDLPVAGRVALDRQRTVVPGSGSDFDVRQCLPDHADRKADSRVRKLGDVLRRLVGGVFPETARREAIRSGQQVHRTANRETTIDHPSSRRCGGRQCRRAKRACRARRSERPAATPCRR